MGQLFGKLAKAEVKAPDRFEIGPRAKTLAVPGWMQTKHALGVAGLSTHPTAVLYRDCSAAPVFRAYKAGVADPQLWGTLIATIDVTYDADGKRPGKLYVVCVPDGGADRFRAFFSEDQSAAESWNADQKQTCGFDGHTLPLCDASTAGFAVHTKIIFAKVLDLCGALNKAGGAPSLSFQYHCSEGLGGFEKISVEQKKKWLQKIAYVLDGKQTEKPSLPQSSFLLPEALRASKTCADKFRGGQTVKDLFMQLAGDGTDDLQRAERCRPFPAFDSALQALALDFWPSFGRWMATEPPALRLAEIEKVGGLIVLRASRMAMRAWTVAVAAASAAEKLCPVVFVVLAGKATGGDDISLTPSAWKRLDCVDDKSEDTAIPLSDSEKEGYADMQARALREEQRRPQGIAPFKFAEGDHAASTHDQDLLSCCWLFVEHRDLISSEHFAPPFGNEPLEEIRATLTKFTAMLRSPDTAYPLTAAYVKAEAFEPLLASLDTHYSDTYTSATAALYRHIVGIVGC